MLADSDLQQTLASPPHPGPLEERESFLPSAGLFTRSVRAAAASVARLIVLHGYSDHSGRYLHLMRWMADRGVCCHAFDFRGHGRSSGRRGHVRRWDEYLDDLRTILSLDATRPGPHPDGPLFVLGHSHGGLVAAAAGIEGVLGGGIAGCILSAPYFADATPQPRLKVAFALVANRLVPWLRVRTGLSDTLMTSDEAMLAESRADPLLLRTATPRWFFTTRAKQREVRARAADFTLPLLALLGDADRVADPAAGLAFFESAGSPDKQVQMYPRLRHELLREAGRDAVFVRILDWMRARGT